MVKNDTPLDDPSSIELELLSKLVADYEEEYFSMYKNPCYRLYFFPFFHSVSYCPTLHSNDNKAVILIQKAWEDTTK